MLGPRQACRLVAGIVVAPTVIAGGLAILMWPGLALAMPMFPSPQFEMPSEANRAAAADFNLDGHLDLAVSSTSGSIVAFMGLGDGSFSAAIPIGTGGPAIATGDFNGDGLVDVAALSSSAVIMFPRLSGGAFGPGTTTSTGEARTQLVTGDMNHDGRTDIVVASTTGWWAMLGQTNGTFALAWGNSFYLDLRTVALGDYNGDGEWDLEVVNSGSFYQTEWLYGRSVVHGLGDGTFSAPTFGSSAQPGSVRSMAAGDIDGDGRDDLAVAVNGESGGRVDVYFGEADGTQTLLSVDGSPGDWVSIGDMDGDGLRDLVMNTYGRSQIMVHTGPRALTALATQPSASSCNALGDFDGDGHLDAAFTGGDKAVYRGSGNGTLVIPRIDIGQFAYSVVIGDLDQDGNLDVMGAKNGLPYQISISLGQGNGDFDPPVAYDTVVGVNDVAFCDVDGDGLEDAVAVGSPGGVGGGVWVHHGAGSGVLLPPVQFDIPQHYPTGVVCDDLNGDGRDDLIVQHAGTRDISVLLGRADRVLGPEVRYALTDGVSDTALGDIDEDGDVDLVVGAYGSLNYFAGEGDGTFAPFVTLATGLSVYSMALADLDRDGHLDLAVGASSPSRVAVYRGAGDGSFAAGQVVAVSNYPYSMAISDLDRDGWPDVVGTASHSFSVLLGRGPGGLGPERHYAMPMDTNELAVGDFDSDGAPDLAVSSHTGIAVLRNSSPALSDMDDDGVADGVDNCAMVANPGQANLDGDGHGDACDCEPADATVFALPGEVSSLGLGGAALTWDSMASMAGSGTVYDVVRGGLAELHGGPGAGGVCLQSGIGPPTLAETTAPDPGRGFWYLVRARNSCGAGSYGADSHGIPRSPAACP